MANIIAIKRRMQTAQNVSKTTKAMQMIATSKLKRAQSAALSSRAYVEKLTAVTKNLTGKLEEDEKSNYMKENPKIKKTLIIVLSPDKGLCGGLITNLSKELLIQDETLGDVEYITIGKKLENTPVRLGKEILGSFEFGTTLPLFDAVYPIAKMIDDEFLGRKVAEVKILYSHFLTVFTQIPKMRTILPVRIEAGTENPEPAPFTLIEPNARDILPIILRHYLEMSIYQLLLESYASEQGARMVAMKNATENAIDIIEDLKLEYNKERQEKITNGILDIGSGTPSLMYE